MTIGEFKKVISCSKKCVICDGWLDDEIVFYGNLYDIPAKIRKLEIAYAYLDADVVKIFTTRYFVETRHYWYMPQGTIDKLLSGDIKPFSKKTISD